MYLRLDLFRNSRLVPLSRPGGGGRGGVPRAHLSGPPPGGGLPAPRPRAPLHGAGGGRPLQEPPPERAPEDGAHRLVPHLLPGEGGCAQGGRRVPQLVRL